MHLLNHKHLLLTKFYDILNDLGVDLKIVSSKEFEDLIEKMLHDDSSSSILQGIIRDFNSEKKLIYESNIKIKSEFTKEFLKKVNFEWPEINKEYIKKYLEYFIYLTRLIMSYTSASIYQEFYIYIHLFPCD